MKHKHNKKEDRRDKLIFNVYDLYMVSEKLLNDNPKIMESQANAIVLPKDKFFKYVINMPVQEFIIGLDHYFLEIGDDPIDQYDIEFYGKITETTDSTILLNAKFGKLIEKNA